MMKKVLFLAALAATVGFTACNKDNEGGNPAEGDNVVVVKLPDNVTTRVGEAPVAGSSVTAVINDVTVFLLNNDAVVKLYDFSLAERTAKEAHIENVPASVNGVLVVANNPLTGTDLTTFKALTSAAAIKSYAFTIASQNGAGKITTQTLMGSTTTLTTVTPDPVVGHEGREYKECTVALDALTARFEIAGVTAGTGIESVEIVGVWINSFYKDGKKETPVQTYGSSDTVWDVTGLPAGNVVGTPSATAFSTHTLATYPYTDYHDAGDAAVVASATPGKVYAYQVFAGANIPHLILLVKGKYTAAYTVNGEEYFMGYLTFTKFNDGTIDIPSVANNVIYKVGHTADGIKINAPDITPEPELKIYDLGVTVTVTPWTDKYVTPGL